MLMVMERSWRWQDLVERDLLGLVVEQLCC